LKQAGCAVASCPRSNARHGHGEPPLARYFEAGLPLGLGTDSVVSVETLDLLAEAREAMRLAGLNADQALRLATRGGAEVLGRAGDLGSLALGKLGDLCLVEVPPATCSHAGEAAEAALAAGGAAVIATYVGGRRVYGESHRQPLGALSTA
ncbi:MAG TPA: amidohydrolase family protein, partial [Gemmatimonadales bacterium]|nr:amidohydrolase family protein [Gemmatimonadales bacterium]